LVNIYGGGFRTNENGLKFEQETSLKSFIENSINYRVIDDNVYFHETCVGRLMGKHDLYKYLLNEMKINYKDYLSKQMLPDDAFYNYNNSIIYIIEKKFQNVAGSVDEKLQTCDFKRKQYTKLFSSVGFACEYIYVLNDWFKNPTYQDVLNYITDSKCSYYFNNIPLQGLGLAD